ncbi:TylF/MycF family methyltransferase [Streptomyces olivaceus]|nr:TylF/MycF family methyltransferase [Streptomyces olivaceus]MBZ6138168.1 TylF/MycF family methyltransferase [Streptomyces olivaceus]MBZ6169281.1 TylF/MycF family methyltransferase [Streptomyces olivaceus]MBZ6247531.1 TylF/MycF family methyltransferase [Streptomyces olivaceus]MBZ6255947.1 TylF/MycF family methyltransferase [Streptomyces olivaceus]
MTTTTYPCVPNPCTTDQRAKFGIAGPIQDIDGLGVY